MQKRNYNNKNVGETLEMVKKQIEDRDYGFFMRNKEQQEYHPSNVTFTKDIYRKAYILQDMAGLVTSNEISHFVSNFAYKIRHEKYDKITTEELRLIEKFTKDSIEEYRKLDYVNLENHVSG